MKIYYVDADLKYSHSCRIKAKNKTDARKKAMKKLIKIASKQTEWNLDICED